MRIISAVKAKKIVDKHKYNKSYKDELKYLSWSIKKAASQGYTSTLRYYTYRYLDIAKTMGNLFKEAGYDVSFNKSKTFINSDYESVGGMLEISWDNPKEIK